jgi:hypothetical protein
MRVRVEFLRRVVHALHQLLETDRLGKNDYYP